MRIAIMQPYLFPYKGYFDLIAAADKFVVYDDAKYMKSKYINRNYFPMLYTFRLKKHSDYAKINECYFFDIEEDKKIFKRKTRIDSRYVEMLDGELDIAKNIAVTLEAICRDLGIGTEFYFSSDIEHGGFVDGVLDITRALGGDTYINAPGGKALYSQDQFGEIKLEFIETTSGPSILCEL